MAKTRVVMVGAGDIGPDRQGIHWELEPLDLKESDMPFSSQRQVLRQMLEFLRTGKTPSSDCHDNIRTLAMAHAAIESSEKGRWVPVRQPQWYERSRSAADLPR